MTDTDLALWGMIVVPIGVVVCFGVALVLWVKEEMVAGPAEEEEWKNKG